MAVVVTQTFKNVSPDQVQEVAVEMDVRNDPPQGLIVHTAIAIPGGGIRAVDVWESKSSFEKFASTRLAPTVAKVAANHGLELEPPTIDISDAFEIILP